MVQMIVPHSVEGLTGPSPVQAMVPCAVQPHGEPVAVETPGPIARKGVVVPSLADYRILVSKVLDDVEMGRSQARNFDNYGAGHAAIVVEEMLLRAKDFVHCFAQRLSADVYSVDGFEAFLKRCPNGRIEIVVEEPDAFRDEFSALRGADKFIGHPQVYVGWYKPDFDVEHVINIDNRIARIETSRENRTASVVASNVGATAIEDAEALFQQVRRLSSVVRS